MHISIVIPAYNEAKRLSPFLDRLIPYCKRKEECEIMVVDDGSSDKTSEIAESYKAK